MREKVISVRNASKSFQDGETERDILKNINFGLDVAQSCAILGSSGSGKTTLLQAMAGLDNFSSGSATLCGYDLQDIKEKELTRLHRHFVGFVYQKSHLLVDFSLIENVALPMLIAGTSKELALEHAIKILSDLGLASFSHYFPCQISGGMQQKVAIARAFASKPKVIFADEPTGNLDGKSKDLVLSCLFELKSEYDTALCLVTHDPYVANRTDIVTHMSELNNSLTSGE